MICEDKSTLNRLHSELEPFATAMKEKDGEQESTVQPAEQ